MGSGILRQINTRNNPDALTSLTNDYKLRH